MLRFVLIAGVLLLCSCVNIPVTFNSAIGSAEGDIDELLDLYTNSHRDFGCDAQLLINGDPSYQAFIDLIENAQDHINIETLDFDDDTTYERDIALEFVLLLTGKVQQGVQVNLILDPILQQFYGRPELLRMLLDGGVNVLPFISPDRRGGIEPLLFRSHKKLMIADGKRAIVGGMNFGYLYLAPDQWRDTNVLLTGPVVASMQREFLNDWRLLGGTVDDQSWFFPDLAPTGELAVRSVDQRPAENDYDINNVISIALRSAKEYVDIEAPYFNPTDELLAELLEAAVRGVRIRILTNSDVSTDISATYYMSLFWFGALLNNGVEVYLWGVVGKNMHSKVLVVDGRLAMVSTHNFNYRSMVWDTENGAVFTEGPLIEQIRQMVEDDLIHENVYRIDQDWLGAQPLDSWDMLLPMMGFGWLF